MAEFNDIIVGNFTDTYSNLPLKTFLGFEFFVKNCKMSRALIIQDDDALINYNLVFDQYKTNKHTFSTLCLEQPVSNFKFQISGMGTRAGFSS